MRCENCGTDIPAKARFCRICGTPIDRGHKDDDLVSENDLTDEEKHNIELTENIDIRKIALIKEEAEALTKKASRFGLQNVSDDDNQYTQDTQAFNVDVLPGSTDTLSLGTESSKKVADILKEMNGDTSSEPLESEIKISDNNNAVLTSYLSGQNSSEESNKTERVAVADLLRPDETIFPKSEATTEAAMDIDELLLNKDNNENVNSFNESDKPVNSFDNQSTDDQNDELLNKISDGNIENKEKEVAENDITKESDSEKSIVESEILDEKVTDEETTNDLADELEEPSLSVEESKETPAERLDSEAPSNDISDSKEEVKEDENESTQGSDEEVAVPSVFNIEADDFNNNDSENEDTEKETSSDTNDELDESSQLTEEELEESSTEKLDIEASTKNDEVDTSSNEEDSSTEESNKEQSIEEDDQVTTNENVTLDDEEELQNEDVNSKENINDIEANDLELESLEDESSLELKEEKEKKEELEESSAEELNIETSDDDKKLDTDNVEANSNDKNNDIVESSENPEKLQEEAEEMVSEDLATEELKDKPEADDTEITLDTISMPSVEELFDEEKSSTEDDKNDEEEKEDSDDNSKISNLSSNETIMPSNKNKQSNNSLPIIVLIILLLASIAWLVYYWLITEDNAKKIDKLEDNKEELNVKINSLENELKAKETEKKTFIFNGYSMSLNDYSIYNRSVVTTVDGYNVKITIGLNQKYSTLSSSKTRTSTRNNYTKLGFKVSQGIQSINNVNYVVYDLTDSKGNNYLVAYTALTTQDSIGFVISGQQKVSYDVLQSLNTIISTTKKDTTYVVNNIEAFGN